MAQMLAGDIRKGVTFEYKSGVYTVTDFQHVKPGKGAAFVRTTLKNVVTGQVLSDQTFNPTAKLETVQVETKKMTYSYFDGPDFSERVHNFASPLRNLSICNPLAYCRLCYVVPYALEIMPYITFKHPTVATVRDIIPPQMCGHTV